MTVVQPTKASLPLHNYLLSQEIKHLSDIELLAISLSFGNPHQYYLKLAVDLLEDLGDLRAILNDCAKHFTQFTGLDQGCYIALQAMKEICRRSDFIYLNKETTLTNSEQTYTYLKKRLRDHKNETFAALFLDSQHRIIAYEELFQGTIHSAAVYSRPIIERVLQLNAAAIILAHNHPSGACEASHQDIAVTKRLKEALAVVDTQLLDHVVIGDNEVYSIMAMNKWLCN